MRILYNHVVSLYFFALAVGVTALICSNAHNIYIFRLEKAQQSQDQAQHETVALDTLRQTTEESDERRSCGLNAL